jgi:hypothetical protein
MRYPRVLNRAAQPNEPKALEEGAVPRHESTGRHTRPRTLEEQRAQASFDKLVNVGEVVRRVPGAKILRPAAEHRIKVRDDDAEVRVTPPTRRESRTRARTRAIARCDGYRCR